jgi:hypothetical protein
MSRGTTEGDTELGDDTRTEGNLTPADEIRDSAWARPDEVGTRSCRLEP